MYPALKPGATKTYCLAKQTPIKPVTNPGLDRSITIAGNTPILGFKFDDKSIQVNLIANESNRMYACRELSYFLEKGKAYKKGAKYTSIVTLENFKAGNIIKDYTDSNHLLGVAREAEVIPLKGLSDIIVDTIIYIITTPLIDLVEECDPYRWGYTEAFYAHKTKWTDFARNVAYAEYSEAMGIFTAQDLKHCANLVKLKIKAERHIARYGLTIDLIWELIQLICPGKKPGRKYKALKKLKAFFNLKDFPNNRKSSFLSFSKSYPSKPTVNFIIQPISLDGEVVPEIVSIESNLQSESDELGPNESLLQEEIEDTTVATGKGLEVEVENNELEKGDFLEACSTIFDRGEESTPIISSTSSEDSTPTVISTPLELTSPSESSLPLDDSSLPMGHSDVCSSEDDMPPVDFLYEATSLDDLVAFYQATGCTAPLREEANHLFSMDAAESADYYNEALLRNIFTYAPCDGLDARQQAVMLASGSPMPYAYRLTNGYSARLYSSEIDNLFYCRKNMRLHAMKGLGLYDVDLTSCHTYVLLANWASRLPLLQEAVNAGSLWDMYKAHFKSLGLEFHKKAVKPLHYASILGGGVNAFTKGIHRYNLEAELHNVRYPDDLWSSIDDVDGYIEAFKKAPIYLEIRALLRYLGKQWDRKYITLPTGERHAVELYSYVEGPNGKKERVMGNFLSVYSAYLQSVEVSIMSFLIVDCHKYFTPVLLQHDGLTIKCHDDTTLDRLKASLHDACVLFMNGIQIPLSIDYLG
jgi:hypothetical protein